MAKMHDKTLTQRVATLELKIIELEEKLARKKNKKKKKKPEGWAVNLTPEQLEAAEKEWRIGC